MNSENSSAPIPASTLPALPVRRRETLEIFDTALKLYRRYFWVLLGWSALVSGVALVPFVSYFALIFALPVLYGAVSCCVAAAVRGQSVKFSQCWAFTKPRYWSLVGTTLLSYLVLFGVYVVISIAAVVVTFLGVWALSSAPRPLQITGIVIGSLLGLVAFSVLMMVAFGWTGMVPIVVCLEDDKRSATAMGRAFDLLKGNWMRVFGLSLILGLAIIAVLIIVGCVYFLVGAGAANTIFSSNPSESAILGLIGTFAAFMSLFALIWNPAQALIIAVLYLDLRVRREALDLEWTAYASAPAPTPGSAPVDFLTPTTLAQGETALPAAPTSFGAMPASFAAGNVEPAPQIVPQPAGANDFTGAFVSSDALKVDAPTSTFSGAPAPSNPIPTAPAPSDIFPTDPAPSSTFSGNAALDSVFPEVPALGDTLPADLMPDSVFSTSMAPDSALSSRDATLNPAPNLDFNNSSPDFGAANTSASSGIFPGAVGANNNSSGDSAPATGGAQADAAGGVTLNKEQLRAASDSEAHRD